MGKSWIKTVSNYQQTKRLRSAFHIKIGKEFNKSPFTRISKLSFWLFGIYKQGTDHHFIFNNYFNSFHLMLTTTTKSLIFISLLLASAFALQDGDQIALKTHGSFFNAKYQYLNAGTVDGSVGMAKNTDYATASGTWWKAHKLSDGSWALESLGSIHNAQHIYLNANTYTGAIDLVGSTDYATVSGTHWSLATLSDGTVALKSLGSFKNPKYQYLNAGTGDGSINLAANTDYATASGTHWEIVTLVSASSNEIPAANSKLVDFIKSNAEHIKSQPSVDINYCLQQLTSAPLQSEFGLLIQAIISASCTNGPQNCNMNALNGVLSALKGKTDATTMEKIYIMIGSMIGSMAGGAACDGAPACEWLGGKIGATLTCLSISKEVFEGVKTAISTLKDVTNQAGDIGQDAVNAITDASNTAEDGVQDAIDQINKGVTNDAVNALKGVTDDVEQSFTDLGSSIVGGATGVGGVIVDAGKKVEETAVDVGNQIKGGFCGIFGC